MFIRKYLVLLLALANFNVKLCEASKSPKDESPRRVVTPAFKLPANLDELKDREWHYIAIFGLWCRKVSEEKVECSKELKYELAIITEGFRRRERECILRNWSC